MSYIKAENLALETSNCGNGNDDDDNYESSLFHFASCPRAGMHYNIISVTM